jgi:hypothetical protein
MKKQTQHATTGRATTLKQIIDHHFNGGKFQYESYDHKKAEAEFKHTDEFARLVYPGSGLTLTSKVDKVYIPDQIRDKYAIMKPGKLRSVDFAPDGSIRGVKIGQRRAMNFYHYTANKVELI